MSAPLISLQGLSKSFQGNDVVKCVDLTIDKGEFLEFWDLQAAVKPRS
ncbi:MAG: hypothetical protein CM15mP62_09870 [Rhodospirillaceae bacterium]|nr:MAG: hypothetical protein CM15mP62_09870 [Rhodospirillaceae bacterium]